MKKILLGTSALAAAAMLASVASAQEGLTVTVGGYLQTDLGHVSQQDDDGLNSKDLRTSTEIHIAAEGTAANGLVYGAVVELEGSNGNASSSIEARAIGIDDNANGDTTYGYVSGNWGRVEFGDKEGAANARGDGLAITAPGDFGLGGAVASEESYRDFISPTPLSTVTVGPNEFATTAAAIDLLANAYEVANSDKATKITYYTPVFSGFQAGISYATEADSGNVTSRSEAATDNLYDSFVEAAARYDVEVSGVGLGLSAAYSRADSKDTDVEDLRAFSIGADAKYMGFTLGGSYVDAGDSADIETLDLIDDSKAYTLGLQYETGPYVVGLNYLASEIETNGAPDVEYDAVSLGATYTVAPGLDTYAEYTRFDFEGDGTVTEDTDGSVFILGTRVSF